jgi:hypothetical protein
VQLDGAVVICRERDGGKDSPASHGQHCFQTASAFH